MPAATRARLASSSGLPGWSSSTSSTAAASSSVLASINAKDAICLRLTGRTGKSDDHRSAVPELAAAGHAGKALKSTFRRLLGLKTTAQYQAAPTPRRRSSGRPGWSTPRAMRRRPDPHIARGQPSPSEIEPPRRQRSDVQRALRVGRAGRATRSADSPWCPSSPAGEDRTMWTSFLAGLG